MSIPGFYSRRSISKNLLAEIDDFFFLSDLYTNFAFTYGLSIFLNVLGKCEGWLKQSGNFGNYRQNSSSPYEALLKIALPIPGLQLSIPGLKPE